MWPLQFSFVYMSRLLACILSFTQTHRFIFEGHFTRSLLICISVYPVESVKTLVNWESGVHWIFLSHFKIIQRETVSVAFLHNCLKLIYTIASEYVSNNFLLLLFMISSRVGCFLFSGDLKKAEVYLTLFVPDVEPIKKLIKWYVYLLMKISCDR